MIGKSEKKRMIQEMVQRESSVAKELAGLIWELAEPPLQEKESSQLIASYLEKNGFTIVWPFPMLPTAFKAEKGSGKPVVGMLGEYDALPDCGEKPGTYGHGCGHNLLGVAPAVSAVAISKILSEKGFSGTVQYWGCPAEETLVGKAYMARDGGFRGMNACLCWHPSSGNTVSSRGGASLDSLFFEFRGKTAHAGGSPHKGRSALDAAIAMDVLANYLREHVPENVRIHSVLCEGGRAPNVVPEYATIWYYVRGKDREEVDGVSRRLMLCAKGAATATETSMKSTKKTAIYSRLPNRTIAQVVLDNFILFGPPKATREDRNRIKFLQKDAVFSDEIDRDFEKPQGRGSSDEDTVSWLAPLGRCSVACVHKNTVSHNREYTMQVNLPFAYKGMMRGAEILAGAAFDLFTDKALLRKIGREFKEGTEGFLFDPLLPKNQRP